MEPSSGGSASTVPSSAPSATQTPLPTPVAATVYTHWERIDLPDPAPDVYGGGLPSDVAAFGDGYFAVGTINRACCADGDPSLNSGVTWTSADGRAWEVHDAIAAFDHASLRQILVAGSRLLAIGSYAEPVPGGQGVAVPAMWTSGDGSAWQRVAGPTPTLVVAGKQGFVGATATDDFTSPVATRWVVFSTSADGLAWTATSDPFLGDVEGMTVGLDGTVIAFGATEGPARSDGSPTFDAVVWTSTDGSSWAGPRIAQREGRFTAAVAHGAGFVAVGNVEGQVPNGSISYSGAVWTSIDGATWDRQEIGVTIDETLSQLFSVQGPLVAVGDSPRGDSANTMIWVSIDGGTTWGRVADQPAFTGINNEVASVIGAPHEQILGVGWRWDPMTGHPLPQVWLASRSAFL